MNLIDVFWVLREKGTEKYMPQLDGRGYTHAEFREGAIPRLFTSERAAKVARTWWLKGPVDVFRSPDDEVWTMPKEKDARDVAVEIVRVWVQEERVE